MPQSEDEKKQYKKEWYQKNKEKINQKRKEYMKEYVEKNKEKIKGYRKEYREQNKEKLKDYRQSPQHKKGIKIGDWKRQGILPPFSWDEFYNEYEKATNCEDCDVVMTVDRYNTPTTKCADHDHSITDGSPNFRGFVCLCCNLRRG